MKSTAPLVASLLALAALVPAAPVHNTGAVKRWWGEAFGHVHKGHHHQQADAEVNYDDDETPDAVTEFTGYAIDPTDAVTDYVDLTDAFTDFTTASADPAPSLDAGALVVAAEASPSSEPRPNHAKPSPSPQPANNSASDSGHPSPVGETYEGIATWYDIGDASDNGGHSAGTVACSSQLYSTSDNIVAVNIPQYEGSCGRTVFLIDTETGNTATATAVDQCASCPTFGDLDLVTGLFNQLHNGNLNAGVFKLKWYFTS
ncbi:hypothetical protein Q8F55_008094 [Vanrija albida]|uniref:RlpA-like protein double-psi beta-barrel domain-containing protein n=1 Tax=Vanrija albida TaxID=181172 RepID=A0ABR3PV90_9TREE